MSEALYGFGGLQFWTEREIMLRAQIIARMSSLVMSTLHDINRRWSFARVDGPIITPARHINDAYDGDDVWVLNALLGGSHPALRPETTASSYVYADYLIKSGKEALPLCVWQAGKSFRRETNDGASAAKLRFNEFYQLEFQCIYALDTKADYRNAIERVIAGEITRLVAAGVTTGAARLVESDRVPSYSRITRDVECMYKGRWTEMCSISTRTDFKDAEVLEIALGLDRIVKVMDQ